MSLLSAEQARAFNRPATTYTNTTKSLLVMDSALQEKMVDKCDICYVLAKKNMAFRKYPELESRHGVNLDQTYTTKDFAKTLCITLRNCKSHCDAFIHCLGKSQYALHFKCHKQQIILEYHRHEVVAIPDTQSPETPSDTLQESSLTAATRVPFKQLFFDGTHRYTKRNHTPYITLLKQVAPKTGTIMCLHFCIIILRKEECSEKLQCYWGRNIWSG